MTTQQKNGYLSSLKKGLSKTKSALVDGMDKIIFRSKKIDENLIIEELEELLISADLGVKFTLQVLNDLRKDIKEKKIKENQEIRDFLKEKITGMIMKKNTEMPGRNDAPHTFMVVGVNGSGKTTTIGKLAYQYSLENKKVLLVAGDTFRAAAIEQLKIWAERTHSDFISHQDGADPSAVVFDSMKAAKARGKDVLIIDTAGRLHTNTNLMEQLKKIKRVIYKEMKDGPHEILLIMDATTGQNGLSQAKMFHEALHLTGIVLTKLDGTSKGGIVVQIIDELKIPVKYIGIGEGLEDLKVFNPEEFANALF
ncbi:MAG TPA: signal recognition particle-docking protein FtsY [Nitrospinota bacterium]|jgi:fused signal recognition particle receptor|nr:signal recognition particle-docking protein FtsY [Nitrospinota bacterium]